MQKTSVYLPEALKKRLAAVSQANGQSEAELIRSAIDRYVTEVAETSAAQPSKAEPSVPGRLVGVGVGPGPAKYVTVAALAALRRAGRVLAPCTALDAIGRAEAIVREAAPDVVVERMKFVMAVDHDARSAALNAACDQIADYLDAGEEVAFITLGDPNTYSTVSSVLAGVNARRPSTTTETIPGIMAFQALASKGRTVLTDEQQTLVLLPAGAPAGVIEAELAKTDRTVIFYKGGGRISAVADHLEKSERLGSAMLGELIGMPGEQIAPVEGVRDRPASYLSVVIAPAADGAGPTPTPAATLEETA